MKETLWGLWDPLSPRALADVLTPMQVPWWIAGGYALEAFAGHSWREHDDIDAALARDDQATLRKALADWDVHVADPPGTLRPWPIDEHLDPTIHDIWVRHDERGPWKFQLMLDERDGSDWVFRRDANIRMPFERLTWQRGDGLRFVQPEVQLLYKSRGRRAKDELDFQVVLPLLEPGRREWLASSLEVTDPVNPWLAEIRSLDG